jgi:hypothetical protein
MSEHHAIPKNLPSTEWKKHIIRVVQPEETHHDPQVLAGS